jgi:hypothetical protein
MESLTDVLSASSRSTLEEFMALPDTEYVKAWEASPAPQFRDLDGEYEKEFGRNYNDTLKAFLASGLYNQDGPNGYYLRKGFTPLGPASGEGYNVWRRPDGRVERRLRFGTHMGTSRLDGRPALVATYSSFNRDTAWLFDEVLEIRELTQDVYVCCANARMDAAAQMPPLVEVFESYGVRLEPECAPTERTPALPMIFVLWGPTAPFAGVDDPSAEAR